MPALGKHTIYDDLNLSLEVIDRLSANAPVPMSVFNEIAAKLGVPGKGSAM